MTQGRFLFMLYALENFDSFCQLTELFNLFFYFSISKYCTTLCMFLCYLLIFYFVRLAFPPLLSPLSIPLLHPVPGYVPTSLFNIVTFSHILCYDFDFYFFLKLFPCKLYSPSLSHFVAFTFLCMHLFLIFGNSPI